MSTAEEPPYVFSTGRIEHEPRPEGSLLVATICNLEANLIGVWTETAR